MALWPFGKNKSNRKQEAPEVATEVSTESPEESAAAGAETPAATSATSAPDTPEADGAAAAEVPAAPIHDAVNGASGPFDGDSVDIEEFDFSDFSSGTLNLGSMKVTLPKQSQVQVEMGEQGPKMLHVVTAVGRITPVAFAAPRTGSQWEDASAEIASGMRKEGIEVKVELGPWGPEVVGTNQTGVIRILGVDGPRWMLRMTLAAPADKAEELAVLGREVTARTFVYRGDDPILAGSSLPVALPTQLAQQVQEAVQKRNQQQGQKTGQPAPPPGQGSAAMTAEEEQQIKAAREALRSQQNQSGN